MKIIGSILLLAIVCAGCSEKQQNTSESKTIVEEKVAQSDVSESDHSVEVELCDTHMDLQKSFLTAYLCDDEVIGGSIIDTGMLISEISLEDGSLQNEFEISKANMICGISKDSNDNVYVSGCVDETYTMWKYDTEGILTEFEDIQYEDIYRDIEVKNVIVDEQGYYYIWISTLIPRSVVTGNSSDDGCYYADRIYVKSSDLETIYYKQIYNDSIKLLTMKNDHEPTVVYMENGEQDNIELCIETLSTVSEEECSKYVISSKDIGSNVFVAGITDGGLYYCQWNQFYLYSFSDRESKMLFDLTAYGLVEDSILCVAPRDEVIVIIDNYGEENMSESVTFEFKEITKTVVTLGTVFANEDLKKSVSDFNRSQNEIQIKIVDYYNGGDGFSKFHADVLEGKVTDLLDINTLDGDSLAMKGLLVDLYDYMSQDTNLQKSDLNEKVLKAYETDQKLYSLAPTFSLVTMCGKESIWGQEKGLSIAEMKDKLEAQGKDVSAIYGFAVDEPILTNLCTMMMDQYIDWEKGECNFGSDEFAEVLEFVKDYEAANDFLLAGLQNNDIMLDYAMIKQVSDISIYHKIFQEDLQFVGLPTNKESGTYVFYASTPLAITSSSTKKDAAWEFIKYCLLHSDLEVGFSVVNSRFEAQIEQSKEDLYAISEDGTYEKAPRGYYSENGIELCAYASTDQEIEELRSLIDQIDGKYEYHEEIMDIIEDEVKAYFSGSKNVEAVCKLIQSRVSIYIMEQME